MLAIRVDAVLGPAESNSGVDVAVDARESQALVLGTGLLEEWNETEEDEERCE